MGLIDVINGMENGPHGPRGSSSSSSGGGMSPLTMAILGLLAYKAVKTFTGRPSAAPASTGSSSQPSAPSSPPSAPSSRPAAPSANPAGGGLGGALGDVLKNGLGGLLAGGAAGSVLSGGLNDLLKQFEQSGQGDKAQSWVSNGPNKSISSDDLANALGADKIDTLTEHTGLSRGDLLAGLSKQLPDVINHLTPNGRLPTEQEVTTSI
jgi:uncharacterized protein YidB (DUF937 family)